MNVTSTSAMGGKGLLQILLVCCCSCNNVTLAVIQMKEFLKLNWLFGKWLTVKSCLFTQCFTITYYIIKSPLQSSINHQKPTTIAVFHHFLDDLSRNLQWLAYDENKKKQQVLCFFYLHWWDKTSLTVLIQNLPSCSSQKWHCFLAGMRKGVHLEPGQLSQSNRPPSSLLNVFTPTFLLNSLIVRGFIISISFESLYSIHIPNIVRIQYCTRARAVWRIQWTTLDI